MSVCSTLSNLTNLEYLQIVGTLKHDFEDEFKCNIDSKYRLFNDPARRKKIHQQTSFCQGRLNASRPSYAHMHKDIEFLTCPCTFLNSQVYTLLELETLFHKFGQLPRFYSYIYKGERCGYLDAPSKLLQAFRVIRGYITEREIENLKKQERELKGKKNGR